MKTLAMICSALMLSSAALAQASGPEGNSSSESDRADRREASDARASERAEDPDERRVCRRIPGATGSRMADQRVCMTAGQWRAYDRGNR